jgi:hypothetical protein
LHKEFNGLYIKNEPKSPVKPAIFSSTVYLALHYFLLTSICMFCWSLE